MRIVALIVTLCLQVSVADVLASDLAREKRMANEVIDTIIDGEPVMLDAGEHSFLGIYTEADEPRGAVIVMHGRGFHPNWADVAYPLRTGLVETGWTTLSLQMPVLHKDAKYYDYLGIMHEAYPRIEAGIDYLKEQGYERVILVAHSCSVHMAMAWVDAGRMRDIDGFIGIGMGAVDYRQPMQKPFPLEQIKVPVLDIYGADEYPAVIKGAPERYAAIEKAGNARSRQIVVPAANHYFTDQGGALVDAVSGWLDSL